MCSDRETSFVVPVAYRTHVTPHDLINVAHILLDMIDGHFEHTQVHVGNG